MTSETEARHLVVCEGAKVSWICAAAMERIPRSLCRIVMGEWIADELMASASVLWVVDPRVRSSALSRGMRRGLPILAPESSRELRRLCIRRKCGLYYSSIDETEEALRFLLEHEPIRKTMGENARRFTELR